MIEIATLRGTVATLPTAKARNLVSLARMYGRTEGWAVLYVEPGRYLPIEFRKLNNGNMQNIFRGDRLKVSETVALVETMLEG